LTGRDSLEDLGRDEKLLLNLILKIQNCGSKGKGTSYIQYKEGRKEGRVSKSNTSGVHTVVRLYTGIAIPNARPQHRNNTTHCRIINRAHGHNMSIQTHAATPPEEK